MRIIRQIVCVVCCLILLGCQSSKQPGALNSPYEGIPASKLFQDGEEHLVKEEYESAIKNFEALDSQYPFSKYSRQVLLNLIYAYYRNGDTTSSAVTAGRYIHLYPRGPNVDYAYYMKGLANFKQKKSVLAKLMPVDPSLRDPGTAIEAYNDFATFIRRFPNSSYVADARQRMIYLRNLFASKELHAGLYYFRHQAYVAAANRASFIVQNYPQAPVVEKALILLVQSNHALGLKQAEQDALEVLKKNYPHADATIKLS